MEGSANPHPIMSTLSLEASGRLQLTAGTGMPLRGIQAWALQSLTFGHASASHLARPPGREKAQGALPLGRRALSHPPVSLTAGHTSWPPSLCPDPVRREPRSPCGHAWPLGAMQPLHVPGGALFGQRCPPWLHVHQRCLDRDPSSRRFRTRPCQGAAGHRRLRALQGEPRGSVCP